MTPTQLEYTSATSSEIKSAASSSDSLVLKILAHWLHIIEGNILHFDEWNNH